MSSHQSASCKGTEDIAPNGLPYFAFRGIPYAQPPLGERRWQLPEAMPEFDDVYNATYFRPACVQAEGVTMSEDCLFLDVYVPHSVNASVLWNQTEAWDLWTLRKNNHTDPGSGVAVMVWIHGGAFRGGSSQENAAWKVASEQGVVLVVIQYRLGALGFLSSGSSELPGNYGLWDQRLALKWVKDNIRGFGGDAAMVTAAGESAGSASVSQHTLCRHSAGLFQRAVMLSGTAEATWSFSQQPRKAFDRFSKFAGCGDNVTSVAHRLRCLMTLPADVIYRTAVVSEAGNTPSFLPTVDGDFIPDTASRLLQDEQHLTSVGFYDYDFLVGTLNNEGVVMFDVLNLFVPSLASTGRFPYQAAEKGFVPVVLKQQLGPRFGLDSQDVVNYEYFSPRSPSHLYVPVRKVFDVYTDSDFVAPAVKMVRYHAKRSSPASSARSSGSSGKSYMFFFDWVPSLTEGTMFAGMPHALDVDYLWGLTNDSLLLYGEIPLGGSILPREHHVSRMYGDMIGAFVRTGDPNNGIADNLQGQWLPYDVINETFLRFSDNSSIDHHLRAKRVSLWIDLLPRLHSRWLNQTANEKPENQTPANDDTEPQELTYFDISESEANALLIALIVMCVVFFLCFVVVLVMLLRAGQSSKTSKYALDQTDLRESSSRNN
ncbi:acetylcholinesterase-like [Babylonia areolata]|uniref:acetylcholinesterase-like n=1 Tax=Babylonia areolata TaxID=304850 RepID=UPI003FD1549B